VRSTRYPALLLIALALASPLRAAAQGDEITLIAPGGLRAVVEQLIPGFERSTGKHVKATFASGLGTKQQIIRGDAFDVPIGYPDPAGGAAAGVTFEASLKQLGISDQLQPKITRAQGGAAASATDPALCK
jgi:hypothetical protein